MIGYSHLQGLFVTVTSYKCSKDKLDILIPMYTTETNIDNTLNAFQIRSMDQKELRSNTCIVIGIRPHGTERKQGHIISNAADRPSVNPSLNSLHSL